MIISSKTNFDPIFSRKSKADSSDMFLYTKQMESDINITKQDGIGHKHTIPNNAK